MTTGDSDLRIRPGRIRSTRAPKPKSFINQVLRAAKKTGHGAENAFDRVRENVRRGTRPDRPARRNPSHVNGLRFERRAPFISPSCRRGLRVAGSRKSHRDLAANSRSPHCFRALAIAIVTRRAETPEGWLGEERSDE